MSVGDPATGCSASPAFEEAPPKRRNHARSGSGLGLVSKASPRIWSIRVDSRGLTRTRGGPETAGPQGVRDERRAPSAGYHPASQRFRFPAPPPFNPAIWRGFRFHCTKTCTKVVDRPRALLRRIGEGDPELGDFRAELPPLDRRVELHHVLRRLVRAAAQDVLVPPPSRASEMRVRLDRDRARGEVRTLTGEPAGGPSGRHRRQRARRRYGHDT